MLQSFRNSFVFLLCIGLFSCAEYEDVQFRQIKDLKVVGIDKGALIVRGNAEFFNPNKSGIKLKDAVIDIYIKDKNVAHLIPSNKVKIQPEGLFEIPIDARINLKESGILNNVLSILGKKEMELRYSGYIRVTKWWISRKIEINDSQKLKF